MYFLQNGLAVLLLAVVLSGMAVAQDDKPAARDKTARQADSGEATAALSPEELQAEVDKIIGRDPQREDYVDDVRCITSPRIRDVEVLDDRHVAFEIRRNEYYLVRFEHRCPGLRRNKPIMYESNNNRLCVHDAIRALYEYGLGRFEPGMRCAIPGFQSMSKEQMLQLKDMLKAQSKARR